MQKNIIHISIVISIMGIYSCYGMERQETPELKKKSKSHFVRKKKVTKEDPSKRRQSDSSTLEKALADDAIKPATRHRSFSLLFAKQPKKKHTPSGDALDANAGSLVSKIPHASVEPADESVRQGEALVALNRQVAAPSTSTEAPRDCVEATKKATFVKVLVPYVKEGEAEKKEKFFISKTIKVNSQKVEKKPTANTAQQTLVRKASLLRFKYATGRSGRDSQTDFSAKELLGSDGQGALMADPSPSQSPRSEDTITPRSDGGNTPRSEDTISPRSDDGFTPRIGVESPREDGTFFTSGDGANSNN